MSTSLQQIESKTGLIGDPVPVQELARHPLFEGVPLKEGRPILRLRLPVRRRASNVGAEAHRALRRIIDHFQRFSRHNERLRLPPLEPAAIHLSGPRKSHRTESGDVAEAPFHPLFAFGIAVEKDRHDASGEFAGRDVRLFRPARG